MDKVIHIFDGLTQRIMTWCERSYHKEYTWNMSAVSLKVHNYIYSYDQALKVKVFV